MRVNLKLLVYTPRASFYTSSSVSLSSPFNFRSSVISFHELQDSIKNAKQITVPPNIVPRPSGTCFNHQSTTATKNIVNSAATELSTGLVSAIRDRNAPEKIAFESTLRASSHAARPVGSSKISQPR